MLRYTYTSGSLYCCTSGHVTLSKITLSHHGVGVDIITVSNHIRTKGPRGARVQNHPTVTHGYSNNLQKSILLGFG